jgi:hypothetical protein
MSYKFLPTTKHEVYFPLRDINIGKEGYETTDQKEISQLAGLENLVMVGTKQCADWEKSQSAPASSDNKNKDKQNKDKEKK